VLVFFLVKEEENMQFTINQAELMSALNAGKASCKKRSKLEVINNVLIQAGSGEVCFTTTDLTMRITYRATDTVQITEEGEYTVNYNQLVDTVKVLPKQADITFRRTENAIEIDCSGRKFVKGMEAEEYPIWTTRTPGETYRKTVSEYEPDSRDPSGRGKTLVDNVYEYEVLETQTQRLSIPCELLMSILKKISHVAADDDSRPVLQAIFINLLDDRLTMVAADAFRFIVHEADVPFSGSWRHPVLIHAKYFVQIANVFPKNAGVEISTTFTTEKLLNKNREPIADAPPYSSMLEVCFSDSHVTVVYRPMEGTYYNYQKALNTIGTTRVVCDTADLLCAYQTVWPIARDASNITTLRIAGNMAYIEAKTTEQPEPTVHEMPVVTTGPDITLFLNCRYMLDFLKSTKAKGITIELSTPGCSVFLRPQNEATVYAVMPMSPNR
jgi:DNA polymerase-3 subunit beta